MNCKTSSEVANPIITVTKGTANPFLITLVERESVAAKEPKESTATHLLENRNPSYHNP